MFLLVGKGEILGYTNKSVYMGQRFLPSQSRKLHAGWSPASSHVAREQFRVTDFVRSLLLV